MFEIPEPSKELVDKDKKIEKSLKRIDKRLPVVENDLAACNGSLSALNGELNHARRLVKHLGDDDSIKLKQKLEVKIKELVEDSQKLEVERQQLVSDCEVLTKLHQDVILSQAKETYFQIHSEIWRYRSKVILEGNDYSKEIRQLKNALASNEYSTGPRASPGVDARMTRIIRLIDTGQPLMNPVPEVRSINVR